MGFKYRHSGTHHLNYPISASAIQQAIKADEPEFILRPGTNDSNINCIPQPAPSISTTPSRPARGSMQDDWSRYGP